MYLDKVILEELRYGGATVKQIEEVISGRVRHTLEALRAEGKVVRDGYGGKSNEYVFKQPPIKRRKHLG
jgi:hypothetical protein